MKVCCDFFATTDLNSGRDWEEEVLGVLLSDREFLEQPEVATEIEKIEVQK